MTSQGAAPAVRVAIIDSGVHAAHPHVQGVSGGVAIDAEGRLSDDWVDRIGHGTAVTAVIREKAPAAAVFAVKVFDRELSTTATALVAGIDWAIAHGCAIVNLSLGTSNPAHRAQLAAAVGRACAHQVTVVAAGPEEGVEWLPGSLPGVIAVEVDWTIDRNHYVLVAHDPRGTRVRASGYPRPIPGVAPEYNLKGLSFAVANVTGLLAAEVEQKCAPLDRIVKSWSLS